MLSDTKLFTPELGWGGGGVNLAYRHQISHRLSLFLMNWWLGGGGGGDVVFPHIYQLCHRLSLFYS